MALVSFRRVRGLVGVSPVLKMAYYALGNSGLAREKLGGKFFCFCPDFFQIFRVDYSFVLAESFIRRVQGSRFRQHGQIGTACPARRCLFADVMKLASDDVPTHEQTDCLARACAAVGSAKFAFSSGKDVTDFVFHRPQESSQPDGFGRVDECLL